MQAESEIKMRHLPAVDSLSVMGVRVGVANLYGSIDRYRRDQYISLIDRY